MAITPDYEKCASCERENPKAIQQCRGCNAVLPWVKSSVPKAASNGSGAAPKQSVGDVAWSGISIGLVGGAIVVLGAFLWCVNVFGFFPTFPLVGYITMAIGGAIWRFGGAMES